MTDEQKAEALRIVDDTIRKWMDDDLLGDAAMFRLRDEMKRLGLPKASQAWRPRTATLAGDDAICDAGAE